MICICFGANDKWVSKLICWATEADYSHTWIEYPSMVWGGLWVAHSSSGGVVKVPQERVRKTYPVSEIYECRVDLDDGFRWARGYIGAKYDYGVIWNAILLVLYRFTKWEFLKKIVWRCTSRMSCSEFGAGILKNSGIAGTEDMDIELTTTGALRSFCMASDDFEIINGQDEHHEQ